MDDGMRIQCRVCKGFAPANQFKLYYKYKQVVCPSCFSGRSEQDEKKKAAAAAAQQAAPQVKKPAGWDKEDEYLEKMIKMKQQTTPQPKMEKIPGTNLVKLNCLKCTYGFKYDPSRKMPKNCPYCNIDVPNIKLYSL